MGKRDIPRGLRDVADLLKHPAISQEVKQQLVAQLSPEDLAAIGYKPPKPAPLAPAVALDQPRHASTPPPLKLVTCWPVEILELDPDPCEDERPAQEPISAGYSAQIQPLCSMAPTSWGSLAVVQVVLLWPWAVTAAAALLTLSIAIHLLSTSS